MNPVHQTLDPAQGRQIPPGLCALAVMTKVPRAGNVKTRLSPPLTPEEAAAINVCFLRDTTTAISQTAAVGRARGIAVYTPIGEEAAYANILPADFALVPQRGNLFGERLISAADDLFRIGFDSVCLIDSDSPTVPQHAYTHAVESLAQSGDRMVLGQSDDGGYYLIGLNQSHRQVFEEIDWSTERVADQTIAQAKGLGLEVTLLPTWYDVDDSATLRRLCAELIGQEGDGVGYVATETRRFLTELVEREGRDRIWPNEEYKI